MSEQVTETAVQSSFATKPVRSLILRSGIPAVVTQVSTSIHNFVDQIFIGMSIGDLGVAATNVCFPLSTLTTALASLLGFGAASRFSILLGRDEREEAANTLGNAITLTVIIGLVVMAAVLVLIEPLLDLCGATELITPYALPYATVICAGVVLGIFSIGISHFARAEGNPYYASVIMLSGALFNVGFDPVFLFVFDMGMVGVALATVLGQLLSTLVAIFYLFRRFKAVLFAPRHFVLRWSIVKRISGFGSAQFATHGLSTVAHAVQQNVFRTVGASSAYGAEAVIASAGAVGKISGIIMAAIVGLATACQAINGFNLGHKLYNRVKETYFKALKYTSVIAVVCFLALQIFAYPILTIFGSSDPNFYASGIGFIHIFLAMFFLNGLQPVTSDFCSSVGRPLTGFVLAILRQGVVLIPLIILLPLALDLEGAFLAGALSDLITAILAIVVIVRQTKWLNARIEQQKVAQLSEFSDL